MIRGTVYTETVVHAAPEPLIAEAPYQLAIVTIDEDDGEYAGGRLTVRIAGSRVAIGDAVEFVEERGGVPFFQKS